MTRLAAVVVATLAFLVGAVGTAVSTAARAAEAPVPALSGRVVDQAGVLSAEQRQALSRKLEAFEQAKGSQVAVLVVPTTAGEAIEDFATRVTDQWKLGRAGVDDGVLLVVAMQERRMRIQTGRGVQGVLTDALSKRIIAERITPLFRAGDFPGGIAAGVDAILAAVSGESLPPPKGGPRASSSAEGDLNQVMFLAFMLVPVGALFLRAVLGRFLGGVAAGVITGGVVAFALGSFLVGLLAGALAFFFTFAVEANQVMSSRGRSGWGGSGSGWGGGSSWGGSGGGFSGGGGGFDGGGASGSW